MKITLIIFGIVIMLGLVIISSCTPKKTVQNNNSEIHPQENTETNNLDNPYLDLREMALRQTPENLGLDTSSDEVFGIVMDWDLLGSGIATLVTFKSDDVSMYLSTGGGTIGAGQHENVQKAASDYLRLGQEFLSKAKQTNDTPIPESNHVQFYFLTKDSKYVGIEKMTNIEANTSEWLKLFEEANKVITEVQISSANQ